MRIRDRRTALIYARITTEEKALIERYVTDRHSDISRHTRELWMRELGVDGKACGRLLQLFRRTTEASLELRDRFTLERFRQLCQELDITKENK